MKLLQHVMAQRERGPAGETVLVRRQHRAQDPMELLTGARGGIRKEAEEEETARSGRHTGELFRGSRLRKKCVCVCVF